MKDLLEKYKSAIIEKYNKEKLGDLRLYLLDPTPASIKNRLIEIVNNRNQLTDNDKGIVRNFLNLKEGEDLLLGVKDDTETYKSVQYFLIGKTKTIKKPGLLDLVALLVSYQPRPIRTMGTADVEANDEKNQETEESIKNNLGKKTAVDNNTLDTDYADMKQTNILSGLNFSKINKIKGKIRQLNILGFGNKQEIDDDNKQNKK